MVSMRAKQDSQSTQNVRITRNSARMESLGRNQSAGEIPAITASAKSIERVKRAVSDSASPLRRSNRLMGKPCENPASPNFCSPGSCKVEGDAGIDRHDWLEENIGEIQIINSSTKSSKRVTKLKPDLATPPRDSDAFEEIKDPSEQMQELSLDYCEGEREARADDLGSEISEYERLRIARISENKARLASLGLDRSLKELEDMFSVAKSNATTSKTSKKPKPDLSTPPRRSDRLKGKPCDFDCSSPQASIVEKDELSTIARRTLFSSSDRCGSKGRGSIYDPILGICCHFCRQKKLCGEEECRRCSDGDINQPCIGKTECSACHSTNGVLCRGCLKVRYGEEMEEVRKKLDWMCPHCIEKKGINPYWICNSSLCLKKRKMAPTGIAIYHAREQGYESVAHLIMDDLKRKAGCV